jgi:UDP-2-acetamido-2,6-beta-L-arabino-hexul-4-ose reductase
MRVGISGANGFLGFHLRVFLRCIGVDEVRLARRETFADEISLSNFVDGLDAVLHCAGVNRGDDDDLVRMNAELAMKLADACSRRRAAPLIVYANSIHSERDTPYGRGKRGAAKVLADFSQGGGGRFVDLVLPNIFGEFGRPFYNSVVATFGHQIVCGETPSILVDNEIELIHVQDVAAAFHRVMTGRESGSVRVKGHPPIRVSALLERLRNLHATYTAQIIPDVRDHFDLCLFNTLRSFMFPEHYPVRLTLHSDARGSLFEGVKSLNGGQVFLSTTASGVVRGEHFHRRKVERFFVLQGEAIIRLRKVFSREVHAFTVSGDDPCYIDMPTFYVHNITNIAERPLMTAFWAHEIFDPKDSDTYAEAVGLS